MYMILSMDFEIFTVFIDFTKKLITKDAILYIYIYQRLGNSLISLYSVCKFVSYREHSFIYLCGLDLEMAYYEQAETCRLIMYICVHERKVFVRLTFPPMVKMI
jgi:hypothetical protein